MKRCWSELQSKRFAQDALRDCLKRVLDGGYAIGAKKNVEALSIHNGRAVQKLELEYYSITVLLVVKRHLGDRSYGRVEWVA